MVMSRGKRKIQAFKKLPMRRPKSPARIAASMANRQDSRMGDKTDRRENVFWETRDNRKERELYMEIQLPPQDHARLADIAQKTGRPESEIVRDVMGTYLDGMDEIGRASCRERV